MSQYNAVCLTTDCECTFFSIFVDAFTMSNTKITYTVIFNERRVMYIFNCPQIDLSLSALLRFAYVEDWSEKHDIY